MTINPPKLARILQTITPVLVALDGYLTVASLEAEAQKYPGPPSYLPFEILVTLLSAALCISALFLWLWRPLGWCLSILLDGAVALGLGSILISAFLHKEFRFHWDFVDAAVMLGETAWFGFLSALLAKRQSRTFFRIWTPSIVEPA